MSEIEKLAQYFGRFPGIGTRQAKRFVYFLLSSNTPFLKELSLLISTLKERVSQCKDCRRYFEHGRLGADSLCVLCSENTLAREKLLIVEKDADLENIRKSGAYHGYYFVLGSLIPLAEIKNPVVPPRLTELYDRIKKDAAGRELKEIILALSATPEGDHTAFELKTLFAPLKEIHGFKITILGRGLSTGSELEYSDGETLKNALESRKS